MLTIRNPRTTIKVNDNPKEIESDNINLGYEIMAIGGRVIHPYIEFDYYDSHLKVPINDYHLDADNESAIIRINTSPDWEKGIFEFIVGYSNGHWPAP